MKCSWEKYRRGIRAALKGKRGEGRLTERNNRLSPRSMGIGSGVNTAKVHLNKSARTEK